MKCTIYCGTTGNRIVYFNRKICYYDIKIFILPNDNYQKYSLSSIESKKIFYNFKNKIKKCIWILLFVMFHSVFLIVVHLEKSNMVHFSLIFAKLYKPAKVIAGFESHSRRWTRGVYSLRIKFVIIILGLIE